MMKKLLPFLFLLVISGLRAQPVSQRLEKAWQRFVADSQLRAAIASLYVVDAQTGTVLLEKNIRMGLAPASTQKVITSITAFDLLGKDYRYRTPVFFGGPIRGDSLLGNLIIRAAGDPSLGSWRYPATSREQILEGLLLLLRQKGIRHISGDLVVDDRTFDSQSIPDSWIWQDMGNYYGAGATGICWNENQYDLFLDPGEKVGDPVTIVRTEPELDVYSLINELKTGPKNSGDNAYIFLPPYGVSGFLRGTIPLGEKHFRIAGSFPYPAGQFLMELGKKLGSVGITYAGRPRTSLEYFVNGKTLSYDGEPVLTWHSPGLDSLIYWFNRKSINLYGEALVKTISLVKTGRASTDTGVALVRAFWKEKGIDEAELALRDGSGLSPLNRVTTRAQVRVLQYARGQNWFSVFRQSLPEYNGMSMKSGTISGVKGFCGYHRSKEGKEYIFSFLVNNYTGRPSALVTKMYRVLDELK